MIKGKRPTSIQAQPLPWKWTGGIYGYIADASGEPVILKGRTNLSEANRTRLNQLIQVHEVKLAPQPED